ncbi:putative Macrophage colony-stimulating factor 1 receptor 2 [Hypsibius exemplaris]|uniref:Macrophage colony-stimulating factor 1 receptor 2 n=1 Tax=Hypsibius exemplaris TaxID=2072580 RepID=A0A1W0WB49_HYPEX|nr:putative Macrophage colony-stimulating factor 1 receptor 2 [Hypsibius exemplaris]
MHAMSQACANLIDLPAIPFDLRTAMAVGVWTTGEVSCSAYPYFVWVASSMQYNQHLLIACCRMWAIIHPVSYRQRHSKWLACILCGTVWVKSDVWSYGVLLWEIFSLGATPFEDGDVAKFSANAFAEWLMQGHQMSRPVEAPLEMYDLMCNCWHILSDDRPTFSAILKILDGFILHVFADTPYLSVENLDTIPDSFTEQMTRFAECQQAVALSEPATLN